MGEAAAQADYIRARIRSVDGARGGSGDALQHGPAETAIELVLERVSAGARIIVADHGPGVPDELKETLFAAFVQGPEKAEDPSPGTGIGLALASQFVQLHGGRLWVEDGDDGGARFLIHLPDDA